MKKYKRERSTKTQQDSIIPASYWLEYQPEKHRQAQDYLSVNGAQDFVEIGKRLAIERVAVPLQDLWRWASNIEVLTARLRDFVVSSSTVSRLNEPESETFLRDHGALLSQALAGADPYNRRLGSLYGGEGALYMDFSYHFAFYDAIQNFLNKFDGAETKLLELAQSDDRLEYKESIETIFKPRDRKKTAPRNVIYRLVESKHAEDKKSINKASKEVAQETYSLYGLSSATVRQYYYQEKETLKL